MSHNHIMQMFKTGLYSFHTLKAERKQKQNFEARTVNEGSLWWAADSTHKGQHDKANDSRFKPFGTFFSFRYESKKKKKMNSTSHTREYLFLE